MDGHHLILGQLVDYITGEALNDTHDERYRQKLVRLLVKKKGYRKTDIIPRSELLITAGPKRAIIKIDFAVSISGRIRMILKYGPGSLVTRQRPALAASRLLAGYQIPFVVVTNGEDAEILEGKSGRVVLHGLESIPSMPELIRKTAAIRFEPILEARAEMESRIIYAFEVDGSCPCDDSICRL